MNRKELIQHFFKNMDSMARIGLMHNKHDLRPKNMPPHAQMGVLFVVMQSGPVTIKELSQHFGMTSSAATQLVNELVKGGYIARKEDAVDRRKICLMLTTKGKKIILQAKEYRMKKMTEMFAPLSDEELRQFENIQTKIVEHWELTCKKKINK